MKRYVRALRLEHLNRQCSSTISCRWLSLKHHPPRPASQKWSPSPKLEALVADDEVSCLASKPMHPLSLEDLVRHGKPPLSSEALLSSANFTLSLLPTRLAHRIQALRNLPFIVVSNPNISTIYNCYIHSFSTLLPFREKTIVSLEDEIRFTEVLADLVQTHSNTISILARGLAECRKYIKPAEVTRFLDEHLRTRIGTRLIAEQHIALHSSSRPQNSTSPTTHDSTSYIGVIDTALQPAFIINSCGAFVSEICELKYGVRPSWVIDGDPSTEFTYVPVHIEYIITELLKNAFRATVESGRSQEPVVITIVAESDRISKAKPEKVESDVNPKKHSDASTLSFSDSTPDVTIRIRDRGGGISPEILPKIWSYSFTTFTGEEFPGTSPLPGGNSSSGMDTLNAISNVGVGSTGISSSIAGLGYGLPLSRAYAEYFGGGVAVQSLYGWGCDVYLRLKGIGNIQSRVHVPSPPFI